MAGWLEEFATMQWAGSRTAFALNPTAVWGPFATSASNHLCDTRQLRPAVAPSLVAPLRLLTLAADSAGSFAPETRRGLLGKSAVFLATLAACPVLPCPAFSLGPDEAMVKFAEGPLGIELTDNAVKVEGLCSTVVKKVLTDAQAIRQPSVRVGLGISAVGGQDVTNLRAIEVKKLIKAAPRPLEIVFRDPELLGRRKNPQPLSPEQAAGAPRQDEGLVVNRLNQPAACGMKTRAGDLVEINYTARLADDLEVEVDSSAKRGTGLPFSFVLGNGEVIKGLDLSLFGMCIGEKRKIRIPARLAYGSYGSKVYRVPPNADLMYGVELVRINSVGDPAAARDNFYTDPPCDEAAFRAGNNSGRCKGREEMYMEQ